MIWAIGPMAHLPTKFHWDILKNERILTTDYSIYKVIYIYIYIYIIYIYIPISHCIEPMFREHLSPEAKSRGMCGSMLLEACVRCGAGCRSRGCMLEWTLYAVRLFILHRPRKEWNVRQSPTRVSVDRVISQVKVLSHQLSWSVHQWFLGALLFY